MRVCIPLMVKCGCGSGDSNTSFSGAVCTLVISTTVVVVKKGVLGDKNNEVS